MSEHQDILHALQSVLEERKNSDPDESYVAALYAGGADKILKKIGEEAAEVILAGKSDDDEHLVYEIADLWFHSLVLLASRDLSAQPVLAELARRFGVSGLEEKATRSKQN